MLGVQYAQYEDRGENNINDRRIGKRDDIAQTEVTHSLKRLVNAEKIKTFQFMMSSQRMLIQFKASDKVIEQRENDDYNKRVQSTFDKFASVFSDHKDTDEFER